jgi:hypothetical protein
VGREGRRPYHVPYSCPFDYCMSSFSVAASLHSLVSKRALELCACSLFGRELEFISELCITRLEDPYCCVTVLLLANHGQRYHVSMHE